MDTTVLNSIDRVERMSACDDYDVYIRGDEVKIDILYYQSEIDADEIDRVRRQADGEVTVCGSGRGVTVRVDVDEEQEDGDEEEYSPEIVTRQVSKDNR